MTRLQQLQKFLEDDPNDPFNLYALALEYQKTDSDKALELYKILMREHDRYIPTYYHLGKLYHEMGLPEEAVKIFEKGIEKAREQNEMKTLRELRSALDDLTF